MLLVIGEDRALTDQVCDALVRRGTPHSRVDPGHATAERGNLFQAAFDAHAQGMLVIEPLSWKGEEPAQPAPALIEAAVSTANAPGMAQLVLVTTRTDDDPLLRSVRRSGLPYVILRPAALHEVLPAGAAAQLQDRTVLIPTDIAASLEGALPVTAVLTAILSALDGEIQQGRAVDLIPSEETSLFQILARSGAKPKLVKPWRGTVGHWFGQAIVRSEGHGVVIEGLSSDPQAGDTPTPPETVTAD